MNSGNFFNPLKRIASVLTICVLLLPSNGYGSHDPSDSSSVHSFKDWFLKGHFEGNFRSYFMATLNQGQLSDYWANAIGGSLGFNTADLKGFSIGVKGVYVFNAFSSALILNDSLTGKSSRYERQLFDVQNPENKYDLDRLEELFVQYRLHKTFLKFGKLQVYTPLVNKQDSRMKPYAISGIWGESRELKNTTLTYGWIWRASPRSTVHWNSLEHSIGIYGNGLNPDGSSMNYRENLSSDGLGVLGVEYSPSKNLKVEAWNFWIENIVNTAYFKAELKQKQLVFGAEYLRQDGVNQRDHKDPTVRYYLPGQSTNLIGSRVGIKKKSWEGSLNYGRTFSTGRFVFPRELGREQFYFTLPRGRVEGLGNSHIIAAKFRWQPQSFEGFGLKLSAARVFSPGNGVDYELDKYGVLSYNHLVFDASYKLRKSLEGVVVRFLYVYKNSEDIPTGRYDLVFNKTNYHHFNLITNFYF